MRIDEGALVPFLAQGHTITRRQDARPAYARDGTVYTCWVRTIDTHGSIYGVDCRPLVIEARDSLTIDTAEDWDAAEVAIKAQGSRHKAQGSNIA